MSKPITRASWLPLPDVIFSLIMTAYLAYKAGPAVIDFIREEGLSRERVAVFAAPAGGPKWFVSVGFDRALIRSGFLSRRSGKVLLAGSSAGAWRCLTMACPDPLSSHERLRVSYSRNVFTRQDTPETISCALRRNVDDFLTESDIPCILDHPSFDLALHAVRSKGPAASENRFAQGAAILAAAVLNALTSRGLDLFYKRVVFYSGTTPPGFVRNSYRGTCVRLTEANIRAAALATGSLPYIISGVRDPDGAPNGVYRDGGLINYQLNEDYSPPEGSVTLFFHYQKRIVPGWLDKGLTWRRPPRGSLDTVLQVFPTRAFVDLLPGKRIPDRNDFTTYVDDPTERIRRWDEVSEISDILGEEFLEDVESGAIRRRVQPLVNRGTG